MPHNGHSTATIDWRLVLTVAALTGQVGSETAPVNPGRFVGVGFGTEFGTDRVTLLTKPLFFQYARQELNL